MATISLAIRMLNGECHVLQVTPETPLASLKEKFMEGVPEFCAINLFLGNLELCDGLCGEVHLSPDAEIAVMKSASPALAVEALREYYYGRCNRSFAEKMKWRDSQRQRCLKALAYLGNIGELEDKDGQVLIDVFDYCVHAWEFPPLDVDLAEIQSAFAKTFAACYRSEVVVAFYQDLGAFEDIEDMGEKEDYGCFLLLATIAVGEVLARDPATLRRDQIDALLRNMVDLIDLWRDGCGDDEHPYYLPPPMELRLPALMATCRLASRFADAALLQQIQMGLEGLSYEFDAASYERITLCLRDPGPCATAAVPLEVMELVAARAPQQQHATAEFDETLLTSTEQRENQTSEEAETEQSLDQALQESEVEAWMQEQGHLHYALLRSKADGFSARARDESMATDRCLVLLRFGRCPKKLFDVLLASPLAMRLARAGVVLQPSWATGRLILAAGVDAGIVSEARDPWNLVVSSEDEHEVLSALRDIEHAERPRLKLDGRFPIPGEVSLFNDLTEDHSELGEDWKQVPVIRTFLHVPPPSVVDPRSSLSAPAVL